MTVTRREIGDLLVDNGVITPEELERVRFEKEKTGHSFPHILSRLGLAGENQLKNALELEYGVNFVSLRKFEPDMQLIGMLPESLIRQHLLVPIARDGTRITVAMVDPSNSASLDDLKKTLNGAAIKTVVCLEDEFNTFLDTALKTGSAEDAGPNGANRQELEVAKQAPAAAAEPIAEIPQPAAAPPVEPPTSAEISIAAAQSSSATEPPKSAVPPDATPGPVSSQNEAEKINQGSSQAQTTHPAEPQKSQLLPHHLQKIRNRRSCPNRALRRPHSR